MGLKKILLTTSRFNKKVIVLLNDFFCIAIATMFAMIISDVDIYYVNLEQFLRFLLVPVLSVIVFWLLGVYSSVVRYIDFSAMILIGKSLLVVFLINILLKLLYESFLIFTNNTELQQLISIEGWLVGLVTASFLIILSRLVANYYLSQRKSEKRVVIYGAGSAGIQLASALRVSKEMQPIAFLDKNTSLHDTFLGGIKVLF